MSFLDDFSYIWSARVLADTGHVTYNGWATAMLGWQLYLGALFIKLFGFSFAVVHASTLPVAMATAALMQRVFVRLEISSWNSTIATMTVTLSPLFLPLAFSFMSDVPGIFCLILCLYACLRALAATTNQAVLGWLIFAGVGNALGGTVRQIAWLGVLVLVPCTGWMIRRRPRALLTTGVLVAVSGAFILGCLHWFKQQPYAVIEPLLGPRTTFRSMVSTALVSVFYPLPILVGFIAKARWTDARSLRRCVLSAVLVAGMALLLPARARNFDWLAPFSHDWWTAKGLTFPSIIGEPPDVLSLWVRVTFTLLLLAGVLAFLMCVGHKAGVSVAGPHLESRSADGSLWLLLGPFAAVYFALVATREHIFDRYDIPLIFVLVVVLLRVYERKIGPRLPWSSVVVLLCFAGYSVLGMHDLFAAQRARLAAANELIAAGVPRSEIKAGFDYDGWTELELAGYINDYRIKVPAGAFRRPVQPQLAPECVSWFTPDTPAIHGRYELSYSPLACLPQSEFAPVEVATWLRPHQQQIYILNLRDSEAAEVGVLKWRGGLRPGTMEDEGASWHH